MSRHILYTHEGITLNITNWAKRLGIKPVTLNRRLLKGVQFEEAITTESMKKRSGKHYKTIGTGNQKSKREHVLIVERAIGREIPKGAVIHHIDGNINNNKNSNLLLCPSRAYHAIIHARERAYNESGNPDYRKCVFCKKYDDTNNMQHGSASSMQHRDCYNAHKRAYNKQKRSK